MILKVGITGGIGSGKSTVARLFEVLAIPVFYADNAAKRLMNEDEIIREQLQKQFGRETYTDGQLNRKYLSAIVFNNEEKLALLNAIVHPATLADAARWMGQQNTPYAIKEAALIFESGANKELDYVIGVYAPEELRMARAMKRDTISKEQVTARMNKQMDDQEKMRLCDYVINNAEQELLIPQVLKIHQELLVAAAKKLNEI